MIPEATNYLFLYIIKELSISLGGVRVNKRLIAITGILLIISASFCLCIDQNGNNGKKEEDEVNVEIIIEEMKYSYRLELSTDNPMESRAGKKFFSVQITARNVGKFTNTISSEDFSLKDTNNSVYQVMKDELSNDYDQFEEASLAMAENAEGVLYFEIPNSSTPAGLTCNPDWSKSIYTSIDANNIKLDIVQAKFSALATEKSYGYVITISSTSGPYLLISEAEFRIIDKNGLLLYKLTISDANPAKVASGESIIYPIPSGAMAVTDSSGGALDGSDSLSDYTNCTLAYIDQNDDKKVSPDDSIWIYKDNDNDGIDEIGSKCVIKILDKYSNIVLTKTL